MSKRKSGLNLTQLTDDFTINGIPWSELKHKLVSKEFDFYSFWVSNCHHAKLTNFQFRKPFLLRRKKLSKCWTMPRRPEVTWALSTSGLMSNI